MRTGAMIFPALTHLQMVRSEASKSSATDFAESICFSTLVKVV
jgi:hypothetical protein